MHIAFAHLRFQLANLQWILIFLWTLPGGVAVAAGAEAQAQSLLFALPTTRDHNGRVVVQATVNGKGPFRFIVDTGATHSTITPDLALTLGLKPTEACSIVVNGITGTTQVSAVTLDRLQTGDLTLYGLLTPGATAQVEAGEIWRAPTIRPPASLGASALPR